MHYLVVSHPPLPFNSYVQIVAHHLHRIPKASHTRVVDQSLEVRGFGCLSYEMDAGVIVLIYQQRVLERGVNDIELEYQPVVKQDYPGSIVGTTERNLFDLLFNF